MIEPSKLASWLPLVLRAELDGSAKETPEAAVEMYSGRLMGYRGEEIRPNSAAIYSIEGVITKGYSWYGVSTEELMNNMAAMENNPNIVSHVLKIDSGGGQGTNLETVAKFIRTELKKPVIAWFNGMACSAAYYIASAADQVYASQETDAVGSIGVMTSWMNMKPMFEKMGIEVHQVYADGSEEKNADAREANEGNYDKLKANMLNPYRERFVATVREMRPQITEEKVFTGAIFTAKEAISLGLIDGIRTFNQVLSSATDPMAVGTVTNNLSMKTENIQAVLGYELQAMAGDDGQEGVFLRTAELEQLNERITPVQAEAGQQVQEQGQPVQASEVEALQATLEGLSASVTALQSTIADQATALQAATTQLADQDARLTAYGATAGAARTVVPSAADASPKVAGDDALEELNRLARS